MEKFWSFWQLLCRSLLCLERTLEGRTLAACDYYFYIILKYPAYYRVLWEKYHLPLKDSSCKS